MQSRGNNKKIQMSKYMVYIVLAVVFVFFAITLRDNGFASTQNLLNILRQTAMISIGRGFGSLQLRDIFYRIAEIQFLIGNLIGY